LTLATSCKTCSQNTSHRTGNHH